MAQSDWQLVQLFLHATPFNQVDPQFQHDIGFYAFQVPFYTWLLSWLFISIAVAFFGSLVAHYLFGGIRLAGRGGQIAGPATMQLAILAGVFVLLKAVAYYFDRFALLSSGRNERFTGASYTDLNAVLPAKLILLFIAVFCAIAFFVGAFLRNLQLPAIATVLLVLSSLVIGAAFPAVLEQISVRPNANEREAESIQRNMEATRQAFGLTSDKVEYKPYQGTTDVALDQVKADKTTIPNIRLLDPSVLSKTFTQLQQRKNFYGFPEKLDVDRYTVNGTVRDYVVAVRELNTDGLAENQRDWINQHLVYTHGNGFVAAEANKVNSALDNNGGEGGYPVFTVSDVSTQGDIPVQQPRIYYGELATSYAIVGGNPGEAPGEYDTDDKKYTYTGSGGVSIGNWFNRLVFAASYGERNILFNQAIGDSSKIIFKRDPRDRVEAVAPWLTVDADPYPAVVDGRIKWIVDGYTTLDRYPYAQQTSLGTSTSDSDLLPNMPRQPDRSIGYIRNSVKATVDAYDGTVSLYAVDDTDPVLKAWMGVFPGTVKPSSEISPALRQHFRYPEDLFKIQRKLLTMYHVANPSEFYSQGTFWDVPSDPTVDNPTTVQQLSLIHRQVLHPGRRPQRPEQGGLPAHQCPGQPAAGVHVGLCDGPVRSGQLREDDRAHPAVGHPDQGSTAGADAVPVLADGQHRAEPVDRAQDQGGLREPVDPAGVGRAALRGTGLRGAQQPEFVVPAVGQGAGELRRPGGLRAHPRRGHGPGVRHRGGPVRAHAAHRRQPVADPEQHAQFAAERKQPEPAGWAGQPGPGQGGRRHPGRAGQAQDGTAVR